MTQFESRLNFKDEVYVDFYHSGGVGNGSVVGVRFDASGKVFYDVQIGIIPPAGQSPQELVNMNYTTVLRNVDGDLVKKIERVHAHADLETAQEAKPVDDGSIQDAVIVEAE